VPDSPRRVAVTGLGTVSCIGIGIDAFTEAVRAGRIGASEITSFDTTGFPYTMACEVRDFEPSTVLQHVKPDRWGPSAVFAASAARLAVQDADLDPDLLSRSRAGSVIGTTGGEAPVIQRLTGQWLSGGLKSIDPDLVRQVPASRIATAVNHELRITGDAQTVPTACSASNFALGYAFDLLVSGEMDFMIAGGADAVNRSTHAGFMQLGALAEDMCRPFDVNRSGILTGEGGVAPEQIDYICAHGTGTPTNDLTEVAAVRQVFGNRLPPISSVKSMIGHTMGAANGFGAAICCRALQDGFLPPTATVTQLDPALGHGVDCVPGTARSAELHVVQNHGFAFGGNNAITIFGRAS